MGEAGPESPVAGVVARRAAAAGQAAEPELAGVDDFDAPSEDEDEDDEVAGVDVEGVELLDDEPFDGVEELPAGLLLDDEPRLSLR
ncbi:hypothetical protein GCM10009864_65980 [Streptomyces lunalinharesii]|uniref:Uncharacterized protein n=1 Tax=Streptomyces lunalinharesii TaxID=333384 RepID=A0ABN3SR59_9ACTN